MILVSACLAGVSCRYDGNSNTVEELENLVKSGQAIALCPEVLGGLPTPRVPCEIVTGEGEEKRVLDKHGEDRTAEFEEGARLTEEICRLLGIKTAVLKSGSPSCGCRQIYDGSFTGKKREGRGLTAEQLILSGITVCNEKDWGEKSR